MVEVSPGAGTGRIAGFDAVVLAGGGGTRLGGVSKADLVVGGERLLDRVLRAASGARTRVVVGAVAVPTGVLLTREDPPGTGPAAGLVAGLDAVRDPSAWTLVLACDLPDAPAAVGVLLDRASDDPAVDGWCLTGSDGHLEWLLGLYRTDALRIGPAITAVEDAARAYGDCRNRSVRGMLAPLSLAGIDSGAASTADLDTWEDHARWNDHEGSAR